MKARHLIALSLAGWYLIAPPVSKAPDNDVKSDAPINQWRVVSDRFGSLDQCAQMALTIRNSNRYGTDATSIVAKNLRCIASDDPRLKSH